LLPNFRGRPIHVVIRPSLGPHLAACSLTQRRILLDSGVLKKRGEFERILIHEIFHFVWRRMGNPARGNWEALLRREIQAGTRGELGWSAEWRKAKLRRRETVDRTATWRRYVCESFCDTAAWRFAGLGQHEEFTLPDRFRRLRRRWFDEAFSATGTIPI
jgi:hypothetical protein